MNDNNFCVILAGGVGQKLWPTSIQKKPKQFLDILGVGETLLQTTFKRISKFVKQENIIVVTNGIYSNFVKDQLPKLDMENIVLEPLRRNTLPSAVLGTSIVVKQNPDANVMIVPADQMIVDERKFEEDIMAAFNYVKTTRHILSLGVVPSKPETNYGYVQMGNKVGDDIFQVKSFMEKPETDIARVLVEDHEFLWNTGIFAWHGEQFLDYFHERSLKYQADIGKNKMAEPKLDEILKEIFSKVPNLTLERACLEDSQLTDVMLCHFGWTDLGTWHSIYEAMPKDYENNVLMKGKVMTYDCKDCIVKMPDNKIAILQGLDDYVVVDDNNILVVCKKEDRGAIRKFVNDVRINIGEDFV